MAGRKKRSEALDPLHEGLIDFYSSQAELMLAQYENINQLLGKTNDWTHPGSHCEILLRDFLRRNLLQWMSVDKGYIYGRVPDGDRTTHCPEIDILIHNVKDYAPVFRLGDFVIVEPKSVLGIIQVKRSFNSRRVNKACNGYDPLDKGLQQCIDAKQHLFDLLKRKDVASSNSDLHRLLLTFSALVSFDKSSSDVSLEQAMVSRFEAHRSEQRYHEPKINQRASIAVMPTFVGSLSGDSAFAYPCSDQQTYSIFESDSYKSNLTVQLLLHNLMKVLMQHYTPLTRPFAFPNLKCEKHFRIPPDELGK